MARRSYHTRLPHTGLPPIVDAILSTLLFVAILAELFIALPMLQLLLVGEIR